jgi:hypothetical protein
MPHVYGSELVPFGYVRTRYGSVRRLWEAENAPAEVRARLRQVLDKDAGAAVCRRVGLALGMNNAICVWRPEDADVPDQAEIDSVLADAEQAAEDERDDKVRMAAQHEETTRNRFDDLARWYESDRWAFRTPVLAVWKPILARGKAGLVYAVIEGLHYDVGEYIRRGPTPKKRMIAKMKKHACSW